MSDLMKIKTQDMIGRPLDWAVAKCEGYDCQFDDEVSGPWLVPQEGYLHDEKPLSMFRPSTSGDTVLEIMEREKISALFDAKAGLWQASTGPRGVGPTLRIAVCRCFCASKLGDEVDIPEELMK